MTETSSFGSGSRESHDSSSYYKRRMFQRTHKSRLVDDVNLNTIPREMVNTINCSSSENLGLPDNSVGLVVTSPPYNVGKSYDSDMTLDEYFALMFRVLSECQRVLEPGGKLCINVANVGRKPYIPYTQYFHSLLRDEIGMMALGEIIWDKGQLQSNSCAWGSWKSASCPALRDRHEYILCYAKHYPKRKKKGTSTITDKDFMQNTASLWTIKPESAKRVKHPAPFPLELPARLIQLYSYQEDVILDPFIGCGTTAIASLQAGRSFIGYDTVKEYCDLARERVLREISL
jgi:modification methylase